MMDDLDFSVMQTTSQEAAAVAATQPVAQSDIYDPTLALEFFRTAGTVEQGIKGRLFFAENEKSDGVFSKSARMYLLLDGEVGLMLNEKFFGIIKPGEIFGELAVIAGLPRSASAMAISDSHVVSLDKKQFQIALQKTPGFAIILMSSMMQRLRKSIALLSGKTTTSKPDSSKKGVLLDKKMLARLTGEIKTQAPITFDTGKTIVNAGAAAALMYIVLNGNVSISIGNQPVEQIEAGGIFGEMALFDNAQRLATATAATTCSLLPIGRNDFIELVKTKPEFGMALLNSVATRMQHLAQMVSSS